MVLQGSLLGLAAAHRRGVVHRDYKPENVLVDGAGVSKLTDFGIAARAGDSPVPAGTLMYAPPEQFGGRPATPASDVYAATATFYECLTGRPPFTGRHRGGADVPAPGRAGAAGAGARGRCGRWWPPGWPRTPAHRPADGTALVAELRAVAGRAYGPDWEDRGRSALAEAALLLAALWPSGGPAAAHGSTVHRVRLRRHSRTRISMVKAAITAGIVIAAAPSPRPSSRTGPPARRRRIRPSSPGTWTGLYICSQGLTGLRLSSGPPRTGRSRGPSASTRCRPSRVPSGEGTITGTYSATRTDIRPDHWMKQPPGYVLVGLGRPARG